MTLYNSPPIDLAITAVPVSPAWIPSFPIPVINFPQGTAASYDLKQHTSNFSLTNNTIARVAGTFQSGVSMTPLGVINYNGTAPVAPAPGLQFDIQTVTTSGSTQLGISGANFTINGVNKFLLGASYYHGRGWKTSDLDAFQIRRITLIRIFLENWVTPARAFVDGNGNLTDEASLQNLVRACNARGIVVDVTIMEPSATPTQTNPTAAVTNTVRALKGEPNVMYDLVNEHNDPTFTQYGSHSLIRTLRDAAKAEHSAAIVTASWTTWNDTVSTHVAADMNTAALDLLTPHFLRGSTWWSLIPSRVAEVKSGLTAISRNVPIFLDEEARRGVGISPEVTQADFNAGALNAKNAGAAGFIFHTDAGFDLDGSNTFFGQLDAVELATLDGLATHLGL